MMKFFISLEEQGILNFKSPIEIDGKQVGSYHYNHHLNSPSWCMMAAVVS